MRPTFDETTLLELVGDDPCHGARQAHLDGRRGLSY
jgi:hypothetical protein